ncbi:MAG: ketoacyl-ACP synthase III [Lachnospiraceae bacterium]|nr:ketoacyl-ACP synthase III [Lachnospiraceae bacterium]
MTGKIIGTGSCMPVRVVSNQELSEHMDTSDAWIRERTGIRNRHIISGEETTTSLAAEAAGNAISMAGIDPEDLDLILLATSSSNTHVPAASCCVQQLIGAKHAACFDISAACSGFVFALITAQAYIRAGMAKLAVVIGADAISNLVDWEDRSSCILFGDGAGAVVVQATEEDIPFYGVMHTDSTKAGALLAKSRHQRIQPAMEETYLRMDGKEIFKFALTRVPQVIHEVLEQAGCGVEDVDLFLLHQANGRIIESVVKKLKVPPWKVPVNVDEYANFSAGTIPVLLDQLNRRGKLKRGQRLVLAGFGAGLAWGGSYIEWQMDRITGSEEG